MQFQFKTNCYLSKYLRSKLSMSSESLSFTIKKIKIEINKRLFKSMLSKG